MQPPLLDVRQISKRFGGNCVLSDVSLSLSSGEVVSIIGENGAGKSTLAKIIAGIVSADSGHMFLSGSPMAFTSPRDAIAAGIGIVHQELCLADNLTVTENIFLGREASSCGILNRAEMGAAAQTALSRLRVDIAPSRLVSTLSTAQKQMVEIARALSYNANILIFDEPTASLSDSDAAVLLEVIRTLRKQGVAMLYVSHRLAEVLQISDRIVTLRDGNNSGELAAQDATHDKLVSLIVGRELKDVYGSRLHDLGAPVLTLKELQATPRHTPCSLSVHAGEIVGIAGLIGSGRTEILESIFGARAAVSGEILLLSAPVLISSPNTALGYGIAMLPEDRKEAGLILASTISENIILSVASRMARPCFRAFSQEIQTSRSLAKDLRVRYTSLSQPVGELSGGNQQKVVLAKCLASNPQVLLLDEPTRGIDVGARREIYAELRRLAAEGLAILFVSSDLDEVIGLADRVVVMSEGTVQGELLRHELSETNIMSLASPAKKTREDRA